jgi:site-specific recombinase XerD
LEKFKADCTLNGLKPQTWRSYDKCIRHYLAWLETRKKVMSPQTGVEFLTQMRDCKQYKPSTLQLYRISIQVWFRANRLELPHVKMPSAKQGLPKFYKKEALKTLYGAADCPRDKALFSITYDAAMRIEEAVTRKRKDFEIDDPKKASVFVNGKTGPESDAWLPLSPNTVRDIYEYINSLPYEPGPEDYMFTMQGNKTRPMPTSTARDIMYRMKARAGITENGAWHRLRHSRATHLLSDDTPITTVQAVCRHGNIKTTLKYAHTTAEATRRQIQGKDVLD